MELAFNTLRQRQNGHHFADDTFICIFVNENVRISIKIPLKFVPKGSINNIPALVQITAGRRPGDKPLSELMMVRLPRHICHSASMSYYHLARFNALQLLLLCSLAHQQLCIIH